MQIRYQLILLGESRFKKQILDSLYSKIKDLGLQENVIKEIDPSDFQNEYKKNAPTVALYFGNEQNDFPHLDILDGLLYDSKFVLPIVNSIEEFRAQTPKQLHPINGVLLSDENDTESLVNHILEGFSLLRTSRRLFISYKRNESRGAAIQLYEKLEEAGFDVFLDTHSVAKGEVFQDELWHRLVDTDVVVLLNTKGFLESDWTKEELAKASAMSIGIIQLIWPEHTPERASELCIPYWLKQEDFVNGEFKDKQAYLTDECVRSLIEKTESLRARTLAARQDNIITEFMKAAKNNNIKAELQPEKFITVTHKDSTESVIIPTIGVPHAFTYNQSADLIQTIRQHKTQDLYLLFDHINIRERWLKHLDWLNDYLPLSTVKLLEIDNFFKKINS